MNKSHMEKRDHSLYESESEEVMSLMANKGELEAAFTTEEYEKEGFKRVQEEPESHDEGYETDLSKGTLVKPWDFNSGLFFFSATDREHGGVLVDSGCTDDIFNCEYSFHHIEPFCGFFHIGEKERSVEIKGKGNVEVVGFKGRAIELESVY